MKRRISIMLSGGFCLALSSVTAWAGEPWVAGGKLMVRTDATVRNLTLSVSGPDGFNVQNTVPFGTPSVSLKGKTRLADGEYVWQVTGATNEKIKNPKSGMNMGRDPKDERDYIYKSYQESGTFRVEGGVVTLPDETVTEE